MAEALRRVGGVGLRLKLHLAPPHEAVLGPDEGLAPRLGQNTALGKKIVVVFVVLFFACFSSFFLLVLFFCFLASMMNSSWSLLSF